MSEVVGRAVVGEFWMVLVVGSAAQDERRMAAVRDERRVRVACII